HRVFVRSRPPPRSSPFPYTTLFRSGLLRGRDASVPVLAEESARKDVAGAERLWVVDPIDGTLNFSRALPFYCVAIGYVEGGRVRSEEHTSELQSQSNLVCRLLLEKK